MYPITLSQLQQPIANFRTSRIQSIFSPITHLPIRLTARSKINHQPSAMSTLASNFVPTNQARYLRACMVCSYVQTYSVRPLPLPHLSTPLPPTPTNSQVITVTSYLLSPFLPPVLPSPTTFPLPSLSPSSLNPPPPLRNSSPSAAPTASPSST